jgi:hypothetical protein
MFIRKTRRLSTLACAALFALGTGVTHAQSMGFGTSNPGSLYHSSGSAIAKMASDKAGMSITVQPFASATVYLPAVSSGNLAFGITNVQELVEAVTGQAHFAGRDYSNLRGVALTYPLRLAVFVRKDSPIKTVTDLKGRRVADGYSSQKTIPPLLDAFYATAGMTRADIKPVMVPNVVGGADAFIQGKVDAFTFAIGAAKVSEADAAVGGLRALPIDNTPEALAAIRKHFAAAYIRPIEPAKPNVGILEPMHVIAYDVIVAASTSTPDDAVYQLTKAMHANKADLAAAFPPFNLFDPKRMNSELPGVAWHPGAIRFYQEQGLWPPGK